MPNKGDKETKKQTTIGRNAKTGKLVSGGDARKNPRSLVVEHVPKKGHGDTKKK